MITYADVLKEKEKNNMTNYDIDEREREEKQRTVQSVKIGDEPLKVEETTTVVDIELPPEELLKLALAAHDRDITLNQLVNIVLTDSLKELEYKFEHGNKPVFLTENK